MKVEIEIVGFAPKQKLSIMRMLEQFVLEMPLNISIGKATIKEVGGKKNGKQISPKREPPKTTKTKARDKAH